VKAHLRTILLLHLPSLQVPTPLIEVRHAIRIDQRPMFIHLLRLMNKHGMIQALDHPAPQLIVPERSELVRWEVVRVHGWRIGVVGKDGSEVEAW
jgi:hypothetical protein